MAGGIRADVKFSGLEEARRIARRIKELGGDLGPLLEIAGSILEASTRRHFDEGRGPGGVPWPPTKRQYRSAVGERGPNRAKILVDKGLLLGAVRHEVRPGEVEIGVDGRSESAMAAPALHFGSHRQIAVKPHRRTITQAFGVPIPPTDVKVRAHGRITNLPARPIVGVDDDDRRDVEEGWLDHMKGLFPHA
jgi:hypothetical protein